MISIRKLSVCSALVAAFLFGTASQSHAQTTPIANGHLKGGPTPVAPAPSIIDLTFFLVEESDGSVFGSGKLTKKSDGGWILFDLNSYVFVGDTLYAAGPITHTHNSDGTFQVGDTFFMAVEDNGDGGNSTDMDAFLEGVVPAAFGPMTIQEILAILGPAPSEIFRQGILGNFRFH